MKSVRLLVPLFVIATCLPYTTVNAQEKAKPLKALLIAGGCCHDYAKQQRALSEGIQDRANVQVDVYWTDDGSTKPSFPLFDDPNWADGYDVIIHDECAADIKDIEVVERILKAHETIPAVHLHCAMHCFRTGTDHWFKHLGLKSTGHGPQKPIEISFVDSEHPITETLKDWKTENEELYNNAEVHDAHPIAMGKQTFDRDGKEHVDEAIVAWVNEEHGARSFSTTIGHNTVTVADPRYLDLVTRGLLWSCNKLNPEYLTPFEGESKVIFIESKPKEAPVPKLGVMPTDATIVKPTASSVQGGNPVVAAFDNSLETRWCAENDQYPQWLQFEFEESREVSAIKIVWESEKPYQYKVLGSDNGSDWKELLDLSKNENAKPRFEDFADSAKVKFIRINGVSVTGGGWCSIREVSVKGKDIKGLWPADKDGKPMKAEPTLADPNAKQGNVTPKIERLSPEQEAEFLKDVTVPEGFEATLFAAPPAMNYPVFVAAAPDGTLYVSSDGNGSLGRDPERGRVIRLRDTDGDGRADETKVFCKIDAPRGLVWDHDRLYLMHPPHLSVFIDKDGDGEADEQKILVKNLAFDYDQRPADHTTNGLSIGADGWLYIAGGDFGFIDAEGTDGRKLTHRGGGVIRVRPDGTGLELYAIGTRNILEVAISPRMDMFARDNTNDGGGWDVRFHHFTGGEDHGYPRLYMRFADECVAPLADYGGGSGCGAAYLDEPGFGEWNDAPLTADWGRGALFHHLVEPHGATFKETRSPEPLVKMTRPTDADVDGMSRLYCASWKGATFKWEGPNVGYIVCVKPKDFKPEPLPEFTKLSDADLVKQFDSPSYRRRLEAQRELMRRGNSDYHQLLEKAKATRTDARNLVERIQNEATDAEVVEALGNEDPVVVHVAIRSLAKRKAAQACLNALDENKSDSAPILRSLAMLHSPEVISGLIERLEKSNDTELRRGILAALCRLYFEDGKWTGQSWGTRPDTRGPYYQPEPWSETERIAAKLKKVLASASPADAAFLVRLMNLNRIQSTEALDRIIELASKDEAFNGEAVAQLAEVQDIPKSSFPILVESIRSSKSTALTLSQTITALTKLDSPNAISASLTALVRLDSMSNVDKEQQAARNTFLNSRQLQKQLDTLQTAAIEGDGATAIWAEAALLAVADNKKGSPETLAIAKQAVEDGWKQTERRLRLMRAAAKINNHYLDDQILESITDAEPAITSVAKSAATSLKLISDQPDNTPKLSSISVETALTDAIKDHGDIGRGELLFTKANCIACHTVTKDVPQIGPYLGNIAATYQRHELAASILQPNKTIAQGFATTSIETLDGLVVNGFVTLESADSVTLRNNEGKEFTIKKKDIDFRETLETSIMPEGILKDHSVHDLSSILDYLQSLKDNSEVQN